MCECENGTGKNKLRQAGIPSSQSFSNEHCEKCKCDELCGAALKISQLMRLDPQRLVRETIQRNRMLQTYCFPINRNLVFVNDKLVCRFGRIRFADVLYLAENERKVIAFKYISDAHASRSGACEKCLEHDGRTFKWPEEAAEMPELPLHPNCKCRYEKIYDDTGSVKTELPSDVKSRFALSLLLEKLKDIYKFKVPKPPRMTGNSANWMHMTWMWFFEQGENPAFFSADSPESRDIANSYSMQVLKEKYFRTGEIPKKWDFTGPGSATGNYAEVEWFIGSYSIKNFKLENGIATFIIRNTSGWHSGTRLPESWTALIKEKTSFEVIDLVRDAPRGAVIRTKILESFPAISQIPGADDILRKLPSWGGNWEQIYEIRMEWK